MKYKWGTGCLFIPESDIDIIEIGNSASCAVSCFFNKLCTHFNYFKNRCYLKTIFDGTSEASAYNDPGATCGFIVERVGYTYLNDSYTSLRKIILNCTHKETDEELEEQQ